MRYFLIDRVTELVVGERIRGVKAVTLTDEVLHDHFPDYPIMPGALIIEGAAQLAGLLLESTFQERFRAAMVARHVDSEEQQSPCRTPRRALLAQVRRAKFHELCGPGRLLDFEVRITACQEEAAEVEAEVTVDGKRAVRADLTFVMKDIPSKRVHEQRRYLYELWTKDLPQPCKVP